jgi:uncharacterized glyoxalase superfamily protein PhnB
MSRSVIPRIVVEHAAGLVMVSGAGARETFPAFLYVYVDDVDDACRRALEAGAASLERRWGAV